MSQSASEHSKWTDIYKLGGVAALSAVLVGLLEIVITFLPGGNTTQETVRDWFMLFQTNGFMGLRDLGLLNILLNALAIPTYFALYAVHRRDQHQPYAALAMIIAFLGILRFPESAFQVFGDRTLFVGVFWAQRLKQPKTRHNLSYPLTF